MKLSDTAKYPLPSPLVSPLDNDQRVVELISVITGESHDEIRAQLEEENRDLAGHHREAFRKAGLEPHEWSHQLEEFYQTTATWFPSHVTWNRRSEKLHVRNWIGGFLARAAGMPRKVLVIGDGAGFDSLYLALCGHDVTYSEPSGPCSDFARRIFADAGMQVTMVTDQADLVPEGYDALVCLDVLEHHPRVPEFVAELAGYLRPGGFFIVSAPFCFVTSHNPTHLRINKKFSGDLNRLYKPNGLRLADGRFFWNPLVLKKGAIWSQDGIGSLPWRIALRFSGMLLAIGRYWAAPHNWLAVRMMNKSP